MSSDSDTPAATGAPESVQVGIVVREEDVGAWSGRLHELAERSVAAGIDHLTVGDRAAGCRRCNFVPEADNLDAAIEAVAEVKALLSATSA